MQKPSPATPGESSNVQRTPSPLSVSDPTSAAETALDHALAYSAAELGLPDQVAVLDRLRVADPDARSLFHYDLARQVAEYLGSFDYEIKAVYTYDFDATPEGTCFGEDLAALPLHLLVWAQRKTKALSALVDSLDRALAQRLADVGNVAHLKHLLDVQVVDDDDVAKRSGYGALLYSLHQKPLRVWKR